MLVRAIRSGDAGAVRRLVQQGISPDTVDADGTPALMLATLYGTPQMVQALLDHGAHPNKPNRVGATALMWAVPDTEKVKTLLAHGADVNARSTNLQRTPLLVAASYPQAVDVLRLLLAKGADIKAKDKNDMDAVSRAVVSSDVTTVRFLVESGGDLNAPARRFRLLRYSRRYSPTLEYLLANGARVDKDALSGFAPNRNEPQLFQKLITLGIDLNAKGGQHGRTALLNAVSAESTTADLVKLLLDNGADPNLADADGERPLDWARYRGDTEKIRVLQTYGATPGNGSRHQTYPPPEGSNNARDALERSANLLLSTARIPFQQRGCITCHNQSMTAMVSVAARQKGITLNHELEAQNVREMRGVYAPIAEEAMQGDYPAGEAVTLGYIMMGLHAEHEPLHNRTAAFTHSVAALQMADGSWFGNGVSRPPMEDSTVSHTTMAVRVLTLYALPGRKKELDEHLQRAKNWLLAVRPQTTEEHTMRLLGLVWTKAAREEISAAMNDVLRHQAPDGGWSQLPQLDRDAYATGSSLYALRQAGMSPTAEPYRKGVTFLLKHQYRDGSWLVRTRAFPVQPYFESGYPFGPHQWISAQGAAWASLAIAETLPNQASKTRD